MNLEQRIYEAIRSESKKLIQRYQDYHNVLHLEHERKKTRIQGVPDKVIKYPAAWDKNDLHDPFYVHRRASSIARSIAKK